MPLMLYKQTNKKTQGFTLIEVLIAIFILAIGIFGVMALIPVGIRQTDTIAKKTIVATSSEIPFAYTSYKYPAGNTSGNNHSIQYILYNISGTTTPSVYYYPLSSVISLTGNSSYGWSMSLVPVDINGDGSTTSVEESYLFRQQIALFNNYSTNTGTANFAYGNASVSNVSNINKVSVNDFICNSQNHVWYRVAGINKSNNTITIRQPYEYGTASSASYISTNTLVALYNTVLTPREWRVKSGGSGSGDDDDDEHHDDDRDHHHDSDER